MASKTFQVIAGDWRKGDAALFLVPFTKKVENLYMPGSAFSREKIAAADVLSTEIMREDTQTITTSKQKGVGQLGGMAVGGVLLGPLGVLAGASARNKTISVSNNKTKVSAVLALRDGRRAMIEGDYETVKLLIAVAFDNQAAARRAPCVPSIGSNGAAQISVARSANSKGTTVVRRKPTVALTPAAYLGGALFCGSPVIFVISWIGWFHFGNALLLGIVSAVIGVALVLSQQKPTRVKTPINPVPGQTGQPSNVQALEASPPPNEKPAKQAFLDVTPEHVFTAEESDAPTDEAGVGE